MKKLFIALVSILVFTFASQVYAGLTCSVTSDSCSDTTVFKMQALDNSHAEMPNQTIYNYYVCCSGVGGLSNSCTGNYDIALKLSSLTNAHVGKKDVSSYSNNACLSVTDGSVDCDYASDCSTLGIGYVCLASISGDDNAHLGDCDAYSTKVCCDATPYLSFTISASSTDFGTLDSGSVNTSSPNITLTTSTNAVDGYTITVQDEGDGSDPGLYSTEAAKLIASATATLVIGTEGYGIQGSSSTATIDSVYDKAGNEVGGLQRTPQRLAYNTGSASSETVTVTHKAAISAATEAGPYKDTITYICTATF